MKRLTAAERARRRWFVVRALREVRHPLNRAPKQPEPPAAARVLVKAA